MECNKWEDEGLLYTSNELDGTQRSEFEKHLSECNFCSQELKSYQKEKREFFSESILGESPSPETDREILRVCSKPPRLKTSFNVFSTVMRKAAISTSLLLMGFLGMGYLVYVMQDTNQDVQFANEKTDESSVRTAESVTTSSEKEVLLADGRDTLLNDSINSDDDSIPFSDRLGDMKREGVSTVDLNAQ
ncbi:MAG: hypothetical protein GF401_18075 [Chitinivibrionales bacterium]|nr:hypothetical protein [Chitinivibrionales bacterium]